MEQISKRLMNWASILEDTTREQAERTATMPFIHPHLALMPDAHLGKGATVGSVIPTVGAIIPAAVGVDIGCGMMAVRRSSPAERPARTRPRRAARGDQRGRPAVGRQVQPRGHSRRPQPRIAELEALPASTRPRRSRRTGACSSGRSARATTSSR